MWTSKQKTLENVKPGARSSCGVSSTSSLVRQRIAPRMLPCRAGSCKEVGFWIEGVGIPGCFLEPRSMFISLIVGVYAFRDAYWT